MSETKDKIKDRVLASLNADSETGDKADLENKKFDAETKAKAARAWATFTERTKANIARYDSARKQALAKYRADLGSYHTTLMKFGIKSPGDAKKAGVRWKPKVDLLKTLARTVGYVKFNASEDDE